MRAKITCVDPSKLAKSFAGHEYDLRLLQALPPGIDPCGENGEFHTFVYDAPDCRRTGLLGTPISKECGPVIRGRVMLTATAEPRVDLWLLAESRTRGRHRHPGVSHSCLESCRGNYFDRIHSDGLKRYLVKRLEQLGHKVTLEPIEAA